MKNILVIGVDLGGTKVTAGLINDGNIIKEQTYQLSERKNEETVLDILFKAIKSVWNEEVKGIGIGVPSLLNRETGVVYSPQNISSWEEVTLKRDVEEKFGCPVTIENDANCFALGQQAYGEGKGTGNFVAATIGTGFGAGIINKRELIEDSNCGAGEFGMLPYLDATLEDYCSGKFFRKYNTTGKELFQQAEKGDKKALEIFSEFGYHLGKAVKCILCTIDPQLVIFGGSVAQSNKYFEQSMWKELKDYEYPFVVKKIKIVFSGQKNLAILGAAKTSINALMKNKI